MDKDFTISVIIPTLNNQDLVEKIILKLNKQTLLPKEIVICDSSSGKEVEEITKKINSDIPISFVSAGSAFPFDRFMIKFMSVIIKFCFCKSNSCFFNFNSRVIKF